MWYVHGDDPTHFSRAVRDVLNNTYHDRWIGRGQPIAWTPCSPDLNLLDFCHVYLASLTAKRHFIALWLPVRLPAATPASLNGCGRP
jgi:hypothetical protein